MIADWARDRILRSNALTLLELLQEMSDVTPVRALFFGGPAHALVGAFGPGFVTVRVDGREATAMDGAQPDLTRFPLAYLQRVRLLRGATGAIVELTTLSRERKDAYSRIEGGTGDPSLSRLRLVYDNGFGSSFRAAAAAELLDVDADPASSDFDFWVNLEWAPGEGGSGLELAYGTESMERDLYATEKISRGELVLRGRLALGEALLLEAHGGRTRWKLEDVLGEDVPERSVASGGLSLAGLWDRAWFRTEAAAWDGAAYPTVQFEADAGLRVAGPLGLDVGGRLGSWEDFGSSELRAGVGLALPLGLTLRAQAATGTRGVSYPALERADSVGFDALTGRLDFRGGPFHLYGLAERQSLDRQLPFGATFDRLQAPGGPADVTGLEGGGDVPVLPLSWIAGGLDPVRARGFFRRNNWDGDQVVLYLPQYLARGELSFVDEFFDGNLEVRLGFGVNHRAAMRTASADAPTTETDATTAVPAFTFLDWNMGIRVMSVLVYFRFDNMSRRAAGDLPGLAFPIARSAFGVKWEFLN
ncbi:MAG: Plug domain-containing protein [Gemmatimonadota bacterium]